jgi:integrase
MGDWLVEWWASTTNLRPSTAARDEDYFRLYISPRFGAMPLAAISQRDVRAWVAELSRRELAPATVQKAYPLLGKVMGAAVDAGMLAQSPCRRVPLPKVEREEMQFLTPAEVAELADAIRPQYRALVLSALMAACGLVSWRGCAAAVSICCAGRSKSRRS